MTRASSPTTPALAMCTLEGPSPPRKRHKVEDSLQGQPQQQQQGQLQHGQQEQEPLLQLQQQQVLQYEGKGEVDLPAEVWGAVMDYLPFADVMRCAAVSRRMLKDALPFVTQLSIYHQEELRAAYARRFFNGNVSQIDVYCLITCLDPDDDEEKFSICQSTACRIVPFLCHFPKLRSVGLDVDEKGIPLGTYFRDSFLEEDSVEIVRSLVRSICGAYQTGAFSQQVKLYGPAFQAGTFICYKADGCNLCKMYCESFPLEQAVNARATCIPVRDRLDAIAKRLGGTECLASKTLVLELLSSNYEVPFRMTESSSSNGVDHDRHNNHDDGEDGVESIAESAIVFGKSVMEELEILCKNYFDTSTLTPQMVLEALTGGEEKDDDEGIYLVQRYHDWLTDLGVPVSEADIKVVDESKLLSDVHIHM